MGAGKHHGNGANSNRSNRRKARYAEGLRMRINALNKLDKQGVLGEGGRLQRDKLERMLDKPRKKALGRGHKSRKAPIPHTLHTYDGHGVRSGRPSFTIQVIDRGHSANKLLLHKVAS